MSRIERRLLLGSRIYDSIAAGERAWFVWDKVAAIDVGDILRLYKQVGAVALDVPEVGGYVRIRVTHIGSSASSEGREVCLWFELLGVSAMTSMRVTAPPIWERIAELGKSIPEDEWDNVPTDLAENLDEYLYHKSNKGKIDDRGMLLDWFLDHHGHDADYLAEKLRLRVVREINKRMESMGLDWTGVLERASGDPNIKWTVLNAVRFETDPFSEGMTIRDLALIADVLGAEWVCPRLQKHKSKPKIKGE